MARRKRRSTRRRWPIAVLAVAIAGAALFWLLRPEGGPRRTSARDEPATIAPNAPRETLDDADREALRDLLERKRSR